MTSGSRYCNRCECRWPLGYTNCPVCLAPTTISVGRAPTRSEFQAREARFERHYQRREEKRIATGDLAPEALGKQEAQEVIQLERLLND